MTTPRLLVEFEVQESKAKTREEESLKSLKTKLIEGKPIELNHRIALPHLKDFAEANELDFKKIEDGFCKAVSLLLAFDHWLIGQLKADKVFSLETLEKLYMLREFSQLVTNTPFNASFTQEQTSAYLMIFSCVSDLQTIYKRKDFTLDGTHKALQNIFKIDSFPAHATVLFFYSFDNFKKYASTLFSSETMNFTFFTYETDDESKKIVLNDNGHRIAIYKNADGFDYFDTNNWMRKSVGSTDKLVDAIKDSISEVEVSGNFFSILWRFGDATPISKVEIETIMNSEKYSLDELSIMLILACEFGDITTAKICLEKGVDPLYQEADRDKTPLHLATYSQNDDIVQLLLSYCKKNIDVEDIYSKTPLYLAAERCDVNICNILIEQGGASIEKSFGLALFKTKSIDVVTTLLCSALSLEKFDNLKTCLQSLNAKASKNDEPWKTARLNIYKNLIKTAVQSSDAELIQELFDCLKPLVNEKEKQVLRNHASKIITSEGFKIDLPPDLKPSKENKSVKQLRK